MKPVAAMRNAVGQGQHRRALLFVTVGRNARQGLLDRLSRAGVPVSTAADPQHALRMLATQAVTLAVVDLADGRPALAAIRAIVARCPGVAVAAVTDGANPVTSAEAMQAGAFDLLLWPFADRDVVALLANASDRLSAPAPAATVHDGLIAQSAAMRTLVERLDAAVRARGVLIAGEPGSGRSYLARVLHGRWGAAGDPRVARDARPFVVEDCAAVDLERRLFGVAPPNGQEGRNGRATFDRIGRECALYRARGGTLCFENLPEAPVRLQARLARLLRDREAELAEQPGTLVDLDARVVVRADWNVDEAIGDGRLRPELYDRTAQARIDLPPLRARREDVPALTVCLLRDIARDSGGPEKGISRAALKVLAALPWRGNVAELKTILTVIVRAVDRQVIDLDDVLEHASLEGAAVRLDAGLSLREAKARFERECIAATLARHQGRVSDAARALGIQRTNLYRKVRELHVVRPRPSRQNG